MDPATPRRDAAVIPAPVFVGCRNRIAPQLVLGIHLGLCFRRQRRDPAIRRIYNLRRLMRWSARELAPMSRNGSRVYSAAVAALRRGRRGFALGLRIELRFGGRMVSAASLNECLGICHVLSRALATRPRSAWRAYRNSSAARMARPRYRRWSRFPVCRDRPRESWEPANGASDLALVDAFASDLSAVFASGLATTTEVCPANGPTAIMAAIIAAPALAHRKIR